MSDLHKQGLITSLNNLFGSSKYSDLTVRCSPDEYKLHRAIVCQRSDFFAAACDGDFREAKTSTITLNDDDPVTVKRILTYLYTLDYDDDGELASPIHYIDDRTIERSGLLPELQLSEVEATKYAKEMNNIVVYAIAEKYNIPEVKELAKAKLSETLWLDGLCGDPLTIVNTIFETTPGIDAGLCNVATAFCTSHIQDILDDGGLNCMLEDHGDLGLGILQMVLRQRTEEEVQEEQEKQHLRHNISKLKNKLQTPLNEVKRG